MAENENQANQVFAEMQSNVFGSPSSNTSDTSSKEAAFKKLPGAAPTKLSDTARERVENALVKAFYPTWKVTNGGVGTVKACLAFLRTQLQTTGALVSGGFILRALGAFDFPTQANQLNIGWSYDKIQYSDIDIYVSCKNFQKLIPLINSFRPTIYEDIQSSLYCNSFLRRNKIRKVYSYHRQKITQHVHLFNGHDVTYDKIGLYDKLISLKAEGNKEAIAEEFLALEEKTPGLVNSMDVMTVRNKKSPLEVVQNFDLTFCQVWYDGKDVWATHPEHIVERVGYLQGDYVKLFLAKNMFLQRRLKKYQRRGFEIRFDPKMISEIETSNTFVQLVCKQEISPRTPDYYKLWAMHIFLLFLTTGKLNDLTEHDGQIELISAKKVPLEGGIYNVAKTLTVTDGYDTEDYEFEEKEPLFELADKYASSFDASLEPLTPEEKFYQMGARCLSALYTTKPYMSRYVYISGKTPLLTEYKVQKVLNSSHLKPCIDALREGVKHEGIDMMYGEEGQLFDFHAHKLDKAVGLEFLDGYLQQNKSIVYKDKLPCYLPQSECTKYLTREDIRPFASPAVYKEYVTTRPPKEITPLGTLTDFGAILRNVPLATDDWGEINKNTMCPFCLRGEERDKGCAYMTHAYEGAGDIRKSPYCAKSEQVKSLWQKYRDYQAALPPDYYGPQGLQWCAICGAPCHGHRHFDSQNPGKLKAGIQDEQGVDNYGVCPGGGRPEMIARMLAIRAVMLAHKDDPEPNHAEIRREAAFAADAAPRDPALMARATAIFAQEAATRKFNNVGLNEYSMTPLVNDNGNNAGNNALPLAPAANLFVGGSTGTRKRKSSLKKRFYTRKN